MHIRSEEFRVFFYEDKYFAAFTINLQEIDLSYIVFMNKILEGYSIYFNRFSIRIIIWRIRFGFYNFSTTRFFTISAYLQECFSVLSCNGVLIEL